MHVLLWLYLQISQAALSSDSPPGKDTSSPVLVDDVETESGLGCSNLDYSSIRSAGITL